MKFPKLSADDLRLRISETFMGRYDCALSSLTIVDKRDILACLGNLLVSQGNEDMSPSLHVQFMNFSTLMTKLGFTTGSAEQSKDRALHRPMFYKGESFEEALSQIFGYLAARELVVKVAVQHDSVNQVISDAQARRDELRENQERAAIKDEEVSRELEQERRKVTSERQRQEAVERCIQEDEAVRQQLGEKHDLLVMDPEELRASNTELEANQKAVREQLRRLRTELQQGEVELMQFNETLNRVQGLLIEERVDTVEELDHDIHELTQTLDSGMQELTSHQATVKVRQKTIEQLNKQLDALKAAVVSGTGGSGDADEQRKEESLRESRQRLQREIEELKAEMAKLAEFYEARSAKVRAMFEAAQGQVQMELAGFAECLALPK
ncbi:Chromosome partition protein Smc [Carpediemonas membranifera]|uniref:Chromosome partition protein Smc n=1 Tax=Carpediemonas membranifera TaxID=201153 RepID=A0A8J6AZQ5_9EUKA|nr:Chromosome partition protein Smc [Carpediemonas membranifera]|eukprot:KAG9392358.1 Chromosome partition protein Smc [Carpediemonas membranifera]